MSAKIINLRTERKRRERRKTRAKADENAVVHGELKAEKTKRRTLLEKASSSLEQHRRDRGEKE